MSSSITRSTLPAALALVVAAGSTWAQGQYPSRPIRIIVPFAAGGPTDFNARLVSQRLNEAWGQPVIVENRPAAGGVPATEFVAKAAPDGYTLLGANPGPLTVAPHIRSNLGYDTMKDLLPIVLVTTTTSAVVVHPLVPARSVKELIALARKSPGRFNFASSGNGSAPHLAVELFNAQAAIKLVHIPYKGGAPALTALMGGEVDLMFDTFITALPHVKSGRTRPLAVTSARRAATFPDLPTVAESGLPGYEAGNWFALFAPAGTPQQAIDRAAQAVGKATASPAFRERLAAQGAEPMTGTPESLATLVRTESARFARLIKDAGIRPE